MTLAPRSSRRPRPSVLRLPPTVHGDGDHGFIATLIGVARERGVSGYVGDGSNRWPAVHRLDAARLFRLAVESRPPGRCCTRSATRACRSATIAEVIGRHLDLPVASIAADEAASTSAGSAASSGSDVARLERADPCALGWAPTHPGLIEDLDAGHYFSDRPPIVHTPRRWPRRDQREHDRGAPVVEIALVQRGEREQRATRKRGSASVSRAFSIPGVSRAPCARNPRTAAR